MTASTMPNNEVAVGDFNRKGKQIVAFKVPLSWVQNLKQYAIDNSSIEERMDVSKIIREALEVWANDNGVDLERAR